MKIQRLINLEMFYNIIGILVFFFRTQVLGY